VCADLIRRHYKVCKEQNQRDSGEKKQETSQDKSDEEDVM